MRGIALDRIRRGAATGGHARCVAGGDCLVPCHVGEGAGAAIGAVGHEAQQIGLIEQKRVGRGIGRESTPALAAIERILPMSVCGIGTCDCNPHRDIRPVRTGDARTDDRGDGVPRIAKVVLRDRC